MCFGVVFACFQKSSSFCRENEIFEKKKRKIGPVLTYKKGNLGPIFNFTAYMCIYINIHMYAVELLSGPSLTF